MWRQFLDPKKTKDVQHRCETSLELLKPANIAYSLSYDAGRTIESLNDPNIGRAERPSLPCHTFLATPLLWNV
jgi:hypothetical protein